MILPNDKHRCPGKALVYTDTAHIITDPYCTGCKRLQNRTDARAQWVANGRPLLRAPWMAAPVEMPCSARMD